MSRFTTAFLALALAAFCQNTAAAQTIKLRYGVIAASARNIDSVALYLAQSKGFLANEGIELDIVPLPGVEHMVNELDKGNVDVSFTATPYLINAVLKGSDSVGVIGGPANTIYSLIVKPEIKSFDDLKGKTIAVSLPIDTISIATRQLLAKHGLQESDFKAKVLIGTPLRADCLAKGECDAAALAQPNDIVFISRGYGKLGDTLEVVSVLQFSVIAARRAWAAANRDFVVRFASAYGEAYRYMADPANREELVKITSERTDATPEVAREVFKFYYDPYRGAMPKQAEIRMDGVAKVIELLGVSGALQAPLPPPEKFVDLQYLKAAGLQ
jgi:ABC-type nitrate/sulfonate/bicarbonate transport system substrate-binding protein